MILPGFKFIEKILKVNQAGSDFSKYIKNGLKASYDDYSREYDLKNNELLLVSSFLHPFYKKLEYYDQNICSSGDKSGRYNELILRNKKVYNETNKKFHQKLNFDSDSDEEVDKQLDILKEINGYLADDNNYDVMTFWKLKQVEFQKYYLNIPVF
ncbi:unnamed protein product [Brachionus calyciflorus]|uniref:Uncharacterized protein n=1 Tax=Brachionus calyciflorus TaxID=104777 RepID=A0A814T0B4_9BILA|nr:unnamed protein product [Brachionus calyciflorus]